MNTRVKGRKAEKEFKEILENEGYIVELVRGSNKFNKSVDFFGLFDGIAINDSEILLFQVKCNNTKGWLKKAKEFRDGNKLPNNVTLLLAVRFDNKHKNERWNRYYI